MNLAEQYAAFKQRALQAYNATEDDTYPYAHIFALFSEANLTVNRRLDIARAVNTQSVSVGTTQFDYNLPADILGRKVASDGVRIVHTDGTIRKLQRLDRDESRSMFGDRSNPSAIQGARFWWFHETNSALFQIGWPHDKAGTLEMVYMVDPANIDTSNAIFGQTAITAAFTNGSATVTFSAPLPVGQLLAGDDIGVGTLAALPSRWYRALSVTLDGNSQATACVLTGDFAGTTDATATFVISKLDPIQTTQRSRELGLLPVFYALGQIAQTTDGQASGRWMNEFRTGLRAALPSQRDISIGSRPRVADLRPVR